MKKNNRPIGVFDSGVGGLTVLREMIRLMPNEKYIYIADLKNSPYGDKSGEEILKYSKNIINFLLKKNVKLIAVACNTASSYLGGSGLEKLPIKIINVLDAGVQSISEDSRKILLAATQATIRAGVYEDKIRRLRGEVGLEKVACKGLVDEIEKDELDKKGFQRLVDFYIGPFRKEKIDKLIFGCTHYPILEEEFKSAIGPGVVLLNPAKKMAEDIKNYLKENNLLGTYEKPIIDFYASDRVEEFNDKIDRILGLGFDKNTRKIELK